MNDVRLSRRKSGHGFVTGLVKGVVTLRPVFGWHAHGHFSDLAENDFVCKFRWVFDECFWGRTCCWVCQRVLAM